MKVGETDRTIADKGDLLALSPNWSAMPTPIYATRLAGNKKAPTGYAGG